MIRGLSLAPARPGAGAGAALALATAAISGLSIYLNAFGVRQVPDAAVYTTGKNAVAAAILIALALALGGAGEARALRPRQLGGLAVIAVVGGSVPFILFFSGLAVATAPTAAFIQKTLFVWVALLAVPLLGERLGLLQVGALGVLLAGQALVAPPSGMGWGAGETMIAAATGLWAVEVVIAKRLLGGGVSSSLLGAARLGLGLLVLVGYLAVSGRLGIAATLGPGAWSWILVTGGLLGAYVATWFAALRLAPASVVTSLLVAGAVVTGVLSTLGNGSAPSAPVVAGYVLISLAAGAVAVIAARTPARNRVAAARAV